MKRLSLLDSAWLMVEAPEMPMHVGVLMRLAPVLGTTSPPASVLAQNLRASTSAVSPWDLILPMQKLRGLLPLWLHECYLDMDHHVRLHRLRKKGRKAIEAETLELSASLHAQPLDRSRPLWECHVLANGSDEAVALLVKVHHALLDGVGGMRLMQKLLAHSAEAEDMSPPWSAQKDAARPDRAQVVELPRPHATNARPAASGVNASPAQKRGFLRPLQRAASELLRSAVSYNDTLITPYRTPASPLNRRITANRSYTAYACSLARIKSLAQRYEVSSNDVVLAICAGALRQLMVDMDAAGTAMTAAVPVSTRSRHGDDIGTALSFCLANLGTDIADPRTRMKAIHNSTQRAKEHLSQLPHKALTSYTSTFMLPFLIEQLSLTGGRLRPMFNVVISNVPGPRRPLYLFGSRLQSMQPLSVLFHGQALNITCIRYVDQVNFGFTACPDIVPEVDKLPVYARDAVAELESGLGAVKPKARVQKKAWPRLVKPAERQYLH